MRSFPPGPSAAQHHNNLTSQRMESALPRPSLGGAALFSRCVGRPGACSSGGGARLSSVAAAMVAARCRRPCSSCGELRQACEWEISSHRTPQRRLSQELHSLTKSRAPQSLLLVRAPPRRAAGKTLAPPRRGLAPVKGSPQAAQNPSARAQFMAGGRLPRLRNGGPRTTRGGDCACKIWEGCAYRRARRPRRRRAAALHEAAAAGRRAGAAAGRGRGRHPPSRAGRAESDADRGAALHGTSRPAVAVVRSSRCRGAGGREGTPRGPSHASRRREG